MHPKKAQRNQKSIFHPTLFGVVRGSEIIKKLKSINGTVKKYEKSCIMILYFKNIKVGNKIA